MIINVKDIKKSYTVGTQEVNALRGINLSVEKFQLWFKWKKLRKSWLGP